MSSLPGCHFKAVFKVRTWRPDLITENMYDMSVYQYHVLSISFHIILYHSIPFYIILYHSIPIYLHGWFHGRTDGLTDGWMDDFMGGWMDWSIWNHNKSIKHNKPTQNKKHLPSHSDFKSFSLHQLTADIQQGLLAKPQASRNWGWGGKHHVPSLFTGNGPYPNDWIPKLFENEVKTSLATPGLSTSLS